MSLIRRLVKFAIVGGLGTIVNEAIYIFSAKIIPIAFALAIAIEISVIFNFVLNDIWTFRDKRSGSYIKRLAKFHSSSYLGNIVQYVVAIILLLYALHFSSLSQVLTVLFFDDKLGVSTIILILTNFFGILSGFLVRFVTSIKYVWA
ncbi:MAG: GtrA family protein [Saccharolobus sp.]